VILTYEHLMEARRKILGPRVEIVPNSFLADRVQYRFPVSKKKRIRQKWAKRPGNYRTVPRRVAYSLKGGDGSITLICHPAMVEELQTAVRETGGVLL
jgi:hypothetical protein